MSTLILSSAFYQPFHLIFPWFQVPSIQTDDSALQNIDLQNKLKNLETENKELKSKIKTLEGRVSELTRSAATTTARSKDKNMAELIEQMKQVEDECGTLKKKVNSLL